MDKFIFTLNTCGEVPDSKVFAFREEKDMLLAWSYFMKVIDADIITGYNIMGFDFKYIYERTQELGIHQIIKEKDY
jgi:DNA polymerase delta subunit 1